MHTMQQAAITAGGRTWTHPSSGETRVYLDAKIWAPMIGLDVVYYRTGNISGATLDGEKISNGEAGLILLGRKIWVDAEGRVTTSTTGREPRIVDADYITSAIAAKLAA